MPAQQYDGSQARKRAPATKPDPVERVIYGVVLIVFMLVTGLAFAFSFGNVGHLGTSLGDPSRIAYLTGPADDLSVAGLIAGGAYLAHKGVEPLWPVHVMSALCGIAMLALNCEQPIMIGHWRQATFDAVAPLLLIGWMMIGPWMLRHLAAVRAAATAATQVGTDSPAATDSEEPAAAQSTAAAATADPLSTPGSPPAAADSPPTVDTPRGRQPDTDRQPAADSRRPSAARQSPGASTVDIMDTWATIGRPLYEEIRDAKRAAGVPAGRQRPSESEFHEALTARIVELADVMDLPEGANKMSVSNAKRIRRDLETRFPDLAPLMHSVPTGAAA